MKLMNKLVFAMLFLCVSTTFVAADDANITGNQLLVDCQAVVRFSDTQQLPDKDVRGMAACLGIVHGVADMIDVWDDSLGGSGLPEGYTTGQGVRIVVKYLQTHPEELNQRDTVLIFKALRQAFPLKKK